MSLSELLTQFNVPDKIRILLTNNGLTFTCWTQNLNPLQSQEPAYNNCFDENHDKNVVEGEKS